ncbi:MAG: rhomboid-like protein [Streptosporangiaceae bacterium]
MSRARSLLARYAVAISYLTAFVVAEVTCYLLSGADQSAVTGWASTSVANLDHDPLGCLVVSAFIPAQANDWAALLYWPVLIALALFGANRALGNARTALVLVAGHVIGTLVSEGIVDYRVTHGLLPGSYDHLTDVGPSYVVVSAIAVAVLCGSWAARIAAVADLAILTFGGHIFSGLSSLHVAPVGHTTAITVAVLLGSALAWRLSRRRRRVPAPVPAAAKPLSQPADPPAC